MAKGGGASSEGHVKLSSEAIAPLHHAAAARLLAVQGHHRLGAAQARKLLDLLDAPEESGTASNTGTPHGRRRTLLWRSQDEQDAEESAQRSRREANETAADVPFASLDEALPRYYSTHNRHCTACQAPLIAGMTSHVDGLENGATSRCTVCETRQTVKPSKVSRRSLRSVVTRERQAKAQKASEVGRSHPQPSVPSAQLAPVTKYVDETATSAAPTTRKEPPAPQTLDERMKQKKRRKVDEHTQSGSNDLHVVTKPVDSNAKAAQPPSLASIDPFAGDVKWQLASDKSKTLAPGPKKVSSEKAALRSLLSQNRAKRQNDAANAGKSTSGSGLQDFLGSL